VKLNVTNVVQEWQNDNGIKRLSPKAFVVYLGTMKNSLAAAKVLLCSVLFLAGQTVVSAQLQVDTVANVQQMVADFFGPSILGIVNVQTKGSTDYWGTFHSYDTELGLDSGLILANGDIHLAIGPNDLLEVGIFDNSGLEGDADLTAMAGYPTEDASVIEFDFVPASDTIILTYVFGSEEYPEWVANEVYNDIMGIWLDGVNVALLPDGLPVCVNNVNCFGENTESYRCNDPMNNELVPCAASFDCPTSQDETQLQYDGLTVPLTAVLVVVPGEVHHLKLGLADVSDNGADSGVFLSASWSSPVFGSVDQRISDDFQVYPNPAVNGFRIDMKNQANATVQLFDLVGRAVGGWTGVSSGQWLDLPAGFAEGVYVVVIEGDGVVYSGSLVVGSE
jgi:hypothetical protein